MDGLMSWMFRTKRSPIGIDVGSRGIKAVQLQTLPGKGGSAPARWRIAAATYAPRRDPGKPLTADEVRGLCATLDRQHFLGRDAVIAAVPEKLLTSMLELPPRNGQVPVEQIARIEVARSHKLAPDAFEMGCWDLPSPARANKATHVMTVAYPHSDSDALLDVLEENGLNVCALDVRASALARACDPLLAPQPGITAMLDIGWTSATLSLLHEGVIVYGRTLADSSLGHLYDALIGRLRLEPDVAEHLLSEAGAEQSSAARDLPEEAAALMSAQVETTAAELRVSFSYVQHQYSETAVTRLLIVGGGAAVPGAVSRYSKALELEVRAVAPSDLAECPPELLRCGGSAAMTLAVGLAQFPEL